MLKVAQSGEKYISAGAQYNIGRAYFQVIELFIHLQMVKDLLYMYVV